MPLASGWGKKKVTRRNAFYSNCKLFSKFFTCIYYNWKGHVEINSTERKTNNPHQCKCRNVQRVDLICAVLRHTSGSWDISVVFFFFPFHLWLPKQQLTCSEIQHMMMTLRVVLHSESGRRIFTFQFPYFLCDVVFGLQIVTFVEYTFIYWRSYFFIVKDFFF